jgi:hypothetical protein
LIEKYKDKWDWKDLSTNKSLPWSIELIEKYNDKWDWWTLCSNKSLYEKALVPYLDDALVDELMAEICKKNEG